MFLPIQSFRYLMDGDVNHIQSVSNEKKRIFSKSFYEASNLVPNKARTLWGGKVICTRDRWKNKIKLNIILKNKTKQHTKRRMRYDHVVLLPWMPSWFSIGNLMNVTSLWWHKGKNTIILMDAEKTFNRIHHLFLIKTNSLLHPKPKTFAN